MAACVARMIPEDSLSVAQTQSGTAPGSGTTHSAQEDRLPWCIGRDDPCNPMSLLLRNPPSILPLPNQHPPCRAFHILVGRNEEEEEKRDGDNRYIT